MIEVGEWKDLICFLYIYIFDFYIGLVYRFLLKFDLFLFFF